MTTDTKAAPFLEYPPIGHHGVIGDRRTAALVANDGTLDWLCLPAYDGEPVFGSLLDADRGGFWRLGPLELRAGEQGYLENSNVLVTRWSTADWELELTDLMLWGGAEQDARQHCTTILRRLCCLRGTTTATLLLDPRDNFAALAQISGDGAAKLRVGEQRLRWWASFALESDTQSLRASRIVQAGDELWLAATVGENASVTSVAQAQTALAETVSAWRRWAEGLTVSGEHSAQLRRSALTIHLLGFAPAGSAVAAPTTSLPERIGGDQNYDYRYAWIRDASLSLASLAQLGDTEAARRYLDWLTRVDAASHGSLQVVYRVSGASDLPQSALPDLAGYRASRPVLIGNRAAQQTQLDSLGYLVDCVLTYLQHGGVWQADYWPLIRHAAEHTLSSWRGRGSGIWELPREQHYVSGKVMSWVLLDRALTIATIVRGDGDTSAWQSAKDAIFRDVMEHGWSEQLGAFRQRYEADTLDAAALLIPVMGFLAADHPRVLATVDRIVASLTVEGLVHRFRADVTPGQPDLPLSQAEGAFLPCTFWLATTYARQGRIAEARATLARAEELAGNLGLYAEEADALDHTFLGNYPLLFSHAEHIRAILALAQPGPVGSVREPRG